MNILSSTKGLAIAVSLACVSPAYAQGIGELGGLAGMGAGLGAGAAAGMSNVAKQNAKNLKKSLAKASSYYGAARKLESKGKNLQAAKYYEAYADMRKRVPNGLDDFTIKAYDKAAENAKKAGNKELIRIYQEKALRACRKLKGNSSPEVKKRVDALAKTSTVAPKKN